MGITPICTQIEHLNKNKFITLLPSVEVLQVQY